MTTDLHTGSSFDSFLDEEGLLEEVEAVAAKRVIAWQIAEEMKKQHITKVAMAEALRTSRSQIDRLLDPENAAVHLVTLARAAHAVGMHITIGLTKKVGPAQTYERSKSSSRAAPKANTRNRSQLEHA